MYIDMLNGMSLVEGGAGKLPAAIAGLFRKRGGIVHTGARVARVDVDGTRATGVTLEDGRRLRACRGIVSTAVLPNLVHDLLADVAVPEDMRSAAQRYRFGPGTFMLHLALEGPIPWRNSLSIPRGYRRRGGRWSGYRFALSRRGSPVMRAG
jgi:phytoene dehydrogenase-like protein